MPILTQDIKILKSAVMNDSSDGGGRMTGVAVIDGQSNSLFPDTSAMDRAFGRVQMRKLFGVAHTNDTDTLMGAHAIITETPADPNVHCTLMRSDQWGDQRTAAKELIERYLVKGPRLSWRIYDTHYAGSAKLRLYAFSSLPVPASGESLCLINPNGSELYVRILRSKSYTEQVYLQEGGSTIAVNAYFAECDLSQTLMLDVFGPPLSRVGLNESQFAVIYTTTLAQGVKFYGTKALGLNGTVGEFSVETNNGIFTPLVPAATVETAVVDQYPLLDRKGFACTGYATISTAWFDIGSYAGKTFQLPTPVAPKTLSFWNTGGYRFLADDGEGQLVTDNGSKHGSIDYSSGQISIKPGISNPNSWWGGNWQARYTPASKAGAATRSDAIEITAINQGLAFTANLVPTPAPSTLTIDYMAQGRWYTLVDNGNGKLSGGDSSYGTAAVNYQTGSVVMTLGALPDVGSCILLTFGSNGSAQAPELVSLPTRLYCNIDLGAKRVSLSSVKFGLIYQNNQAVYRYVSLNATGQPSMGECVVTGDGKFRLSPPELTQRISIEWQEYGDARNATRPGSQANEFYLSDTPVLQRTVSFQVSYTAPANHRLRWEESGHIKDDGAGNLYLPMQRDGFAPLNTVVGSIDYTTGKVTLQASVQLLTIESYSYGVRRLLWWDNVSAERNSSAPITIAPVLSSVKYSGEIDDVKTLIVTPQWFIQLPDKLLTSGLAVNLAGVLHTAKDGVLYTDWNCNAGTGTEAGSVSTEGLISPQLSHVKEGTYSIGVTWYNVARNTVDDRVTAGVFRTANAPLKQGVFQLVDDSNRVLTVNVDAQRGIVRWTVPGASEHWSPWYAKASTLRYNTVYLEYLPLEASILGLNTARLPLDGKVPVYRSGDLCVVHNTLTLELPNPLVKGSAYTLRERLASVRVKDAMGVVVPDTKYQLDLNAGTILFPTGISISDFNQPFTVEHRIEDLLLCSQADISGKLRFTRSLTHDFPAGTSYVSSALPFGDLFARFYNVIEQQTWTNEWRDERIGASMTANFNETDCPIQVTNRGTIKERWAVIFTGSTTFRVVGESVGEIGYGNTAADCAPTNNATAAPYFVIPALGWGAGWSAGNVLRFNTDACGAPFWIVRTILQGPASVESDTFALAFRGDVDRP